MKAPSLFNLARSFLAISLLAATSCETDNPYGSDDCARLDREKRTGHALSDRTYVSNGRTYREQKVIIGTSPTETMSQTVELR